MTVLLLIWLLCGWTSFCIGTVTLGLCSALETARPGDRLVVILWLGYSGLAVMLLALSLLFPLRPVHVLAAAVLATAAAFTGGRLRAELGHLRKAGGRWTVLNVILLAAAAAAISAQIISSRDSIRYHYDIIHFLSRVGSAPGLALVHERFGYLSSWYTVPASFNHGILTWRVGTAGNGFALLLAAGHLQLSFYRILRGEGRPLDLFMSLVLTPALFLFLLLNFPVSPTPDFPTLLLTIVVPWSMILVAESEEKERGGKGRLVPLLLGAAAASVKIVALPLLAATFVWLCAGSAGRARFAAAGGAAAFLTILPFLATETVLTSCPLYPLPACFDLPWTPARGAAGFGEFFLSIRESYLRNFWEIRETLLAGAGLILALPVLSWILLRRRSRLPAVRPVLFTALFCLLPLIVLAPQARFLMGYVSVILFSPVLLPGRRMRQAMDRIGIGNKKALALSLAAVVLVTVTPSAGFRTRSEKRIAEAVAEGRVELHGEGRLLVPPEIPLIVYDDEHDLALPVRPRRGLRSPDGESGRGMFYPLRENRSIKLRSPEDGASGGFQLR